MNKVLHKSQTVHPNYINSDKNKRLIKKHTMDCNILSNYRPVLNFTFVSNVIQRAVALHLNKCLINNSLNESLKSKH